MLQVVGAVCIVVALVGGGLKAGDLEVPVISRKRRVLLGGAGVLFLVIGLLLGGEGAEAGIERLSVYTGSTMKGDVSIE